VFCPDVLDNARIQILDEMNTKLAILFDDE